MARPTPVLPDVGSTIVPPGLRAGRRARRPGPSRAPGGPSTSRPGWWSPAWPRGCREAVGAGQAAQLHERGVADEVEHRLGDLRGGQRVVLAHGPTLGRRGWLATVPPLASGLRAARRTPTLPWPASGTPPRYPRRCRRSGAVDHATCWPWRPTPPWPTRRAGWPRPRPGRVSAATRSGCGASTGAPRPSPTTSWSTAPARRGAARARAGRSRASTPSACSSSGPRATCRPPSGPVASRLAGGRGAEAAPRRPAAGRGPGATAARARTGGRPGRAGSAPPPDRGQERRADERAARVRAGLDELDRWLADQVRRGLTAPEVATARGVGGRRPPAWSTRRPARWPTGSAGPPSWSAAGPGRHGAGARRDGHACTRWPSPGAGRRSWTRTSPSSVRTAVGWTDRQGGGAGQHPRPRTTGTSWPAATPRSTASPCGGPGCSAGAAGAGACCWTSPPSARAWRTTRRSAACSTPTSTTSRTGADPGPGRRASTSRAVDDVGGPPPSTVGGHAGRRRVGPGPRAVAGALARRRPGGTARRAGGSGWALVDDSGALADRRRAGARHAAGRVGRPAGRRRRRAPGRRLRSPWPSAPTIGRRSSMTEPSLAETWDELVATAVLGTDRRPLPPPPGRAARARSATGADAGRRPARSGRRRAGRRAGPARCRSRPVPCLAPCPDGPATALPDAGGPPPRPDAGGPPPRPAAGVAADAGRRSTSRLPPEHLVALMDRTRSDPELRALAVAGRRPGRWAGWPSVLPELGWARAASGGPAGGVGAGTPAERARGAAAASGRRTRPRPAACWPAGCRASGPSCAPPATPRSPSALGPEDEPLLERALDDRARLGAGGGRRGCWLACRRRRGRGAWPSGPPAWSAIGGRPGQDRFDVALVAPVPPDWERDGIERQRRHAGTSLGVHVLRQVVAGHAARRVGGAGPAVAPGRPGGRARAGPGAARRRMERGRGRQRDPAWAQAARWTSSGDPSLVAVLDPRRPASRPPDAPPSPDDGAVPAGPGRLRGRCRRPGRTTCASARGRGGRGAVRRASRRPAPGPVAAPPGPGARSRRCCASVAGVAGVRWDCRPRSTGCATTWSTCCRFRAEMLEELAVEDAS